MKALSEIGLRKAAKFAIMTLLMVGFKLMIFPPLRVLYLRLLGACVGRNATIHSVRFFNLYRAGFPALRIGDDCFIGDETLIDLADAVVLEDQAGLAERVTVLTHTNVGFADHPLQRFYPPMTAGVTVHKGSFVGASATLLPGVHVGPRSVVAAGAVVTEDVPPDTVVGGVPARVIKTLR